MPEDPEIDILVERFQLGIDQEESFRGIFALYHPRILSFFRGRGFSQDESSDLAQESFFQIYRSLPMFRRDSHFGRWAFEVARRVYFNELRKRSTAKRDGRKQSMDVDPLRTQIIEGGLLQTPEPDPLDQVIRGERSQAIRAAIEYLPEQIRRCFKLWYEDGLSYQEIVIVMNTSLDAVKSRLHEARKRLREKLGEAEL